jgi:oxygen-independent coproporphyrinogen-3 oxidase
MSHSIYIHVPFCEARCPYCDFFTLGKGAEASPLADQWLELVARELELWIAAGDITPSEPVRTLFFGGGTPSLVSARAMQRFLDNVRALLPFTPDAEVTIELQPRTADEAKLVAFAKAGINRFSIGAQTFSPHHLERLERRHTVADTVELIKRAKPLGRLSIDLIAALPNQTLDEWQTDLETALSFGPDHLSVYELTYYPGTRLRGWLEHGEVRELDEELRVRIFEHTVERLTAEGYEHYEISNFARPGCRSSHNENYWRLGDYVGLGAGAHSFVFPHRYVNPPDISKYIASIHEERLARQLADATDKDVFYLENLFMGLRLVDGLDLEHFRQRFGVDVVEHFGARLQPLIEAGYVELRIDRLRLTWEGLLRADAVISYLS